MPDVRGSNRAVEEFTRELEWAERDLAQAQERVETLRRAAAGPPEPAGCCWRWEWAQDAMSPNWNWQRRVTCAVYRRGLYGSRDGCDHPHHGEDATWVAIG